MQKRVPQLKEQWLQFYLIFLLTCKVGGRKTNMRGHHGTGTSGWGELGGRLGSYAHRRKEGPGTRMGHCVGRPWERTEKQTPGAVLWVFSGSVRDR